MENKKLGFGFMRLPVTNQNDLTSIDMDTVNHMVIIQKHMVRHQIVLDVDSVKEIVHSILRL